MPKPGDDLEPTVNARPDGDTPSGNGDNGAATGFRPRKIKVKGQEFVVDSESKEIELLQKGAAFERNQERLKERERTLLNEQNELYGRLKPLIEIDEKLRQDPTKMARVNAILNDQPLPVDPEDDTDDPYMPHIRALQRNQERIARALEGGLNTVRGEVGSVQRDRQFEQQERYITKKWDWATDDDLDAARELAEKKGIDLVTAFKAVAFDDLPERTRRDTIAEFGLDERALTPQRSEDLVLEGLGPMSDPRVRTRLLDDPELYHRFKPAIRAERRRRSGKLELGR